MLIKKPADIESSEITSQKTYMNRRLFMRGAILAGSAVGTGLLYRRLNPPPAVVEERAKIAGIVTQPSEDAMRRGFNVNEARTSFADITNYNNFYEFSTDKGAVAAEARDFVTRPWTVSIEGLVNKPKTFDLDDLLKLAPQEERIYRHRCVEGWSMVIPWVGIPLSALIKQADPLPSAKFVAFETVTAPDQMPNQKHDVLQWPYVEGLRMDEAMHPLTILAVGLYDEVLPNVDGAPLRLVVPWKYGFKSIKAIVKINFTDYMPPTTWNKMASNEYGFYSNVNPAVDHPRWSQAKERRIGEFTKRTTLMFNGYGDQVAGLYSGLDLKKNF